jgi:hypothetical protein
MERSLYPEGVEVHQRDLERTETTKAEQIQQRLLSVVTTGVSTGGSVTANGVLVNVGPVTGYAPNGEYVVWDQTSSYALADYALNAINYVLIVYSEDSIDNEPHETNGNTYPTNAVNSPRIVVLSAAEYAALPDTDENILNNALDRAMILAIVAGMGAGVSISSANITLSSDFGSAILATNITGTITGVTIASVEKTTPTGSGTLALTVSGIVKTITWQAPEAAFPGSAVDVSVSGTFTLYSDDGTQYLNINVIASSLPAASVSNTIQITNIYAQTVNRFTPIDIQHRAMVGTGVVSATNPHGLSGADVGVSGLLTTHQNRFHANGVLPGSSSTFLACVIDNAGSDDTLVIGDPSAGDRFYVAGNEYNDVGTGAGEGTAKILSFADYTAIVTQVLFDVYVREAVGGIGTPLKRERARYALNDPAQTPPSALSPLAASVQLRNVDGEYAGGTVYIKYNDTSKTLSYSTNGSDWGPVVLVPINPETVQTIRLWNNSCDTYLDVYVNNNLSGGGNYTATITVAALFTGDDVIANMKIASVLYTNDAGSARLGNKFPIGDNGTVKDQRIYGLISNTNMGDDVGKWTYGYPSVDDIYTKRWENEKDTPATRSQRSVSTLKPVSIGTSNPEYGAQLFSFARSEGHAIVGDASYPANSIGVLGRGTTVGVDGVGVGTGVPGVRGTGGTTGAGVEGYGTGTLQGVVGTGGSGNGTGVHGQGTGSGTGVRAYGGVSGGIGLFAAGNGYSHGAYCQAGDDGGGAAGVYGYTRGDGGIGVHGFADGTWYTGDGVKGEGGGAGYGVIGIGGADAGVGGSFTAGGDFEGQPAHAVRAIATSGYGVWATTTDGDGIAFIPKSLYASSTKGYACYLIGNAFRAPLHLTPQAEPSGAEAGDLYLSLAHQMYVYTGAAWIIWGS